MRKTRHQRPRIQIVDSLFEEPYRDHLFVHVQEPIGGNLWCSLQIVRRHGHADTPDIWANTAKITAKSRSAKPIPAAADRNASRWAAILPPWRQGLCTRGLPRLSPCGRKWFAVELRS